MLSSWLGMHSQLWTFPCSTKRSINLIYWLGDLESSVRGKQKDNLPNTFTQLFSDVSFTMSHIVTCILYWKMAMRWHGVSLYVHWTIVRVYSICKPTFFVSTCIYIQMVRIPARQSEALSYLIDRILPNKLPLGEISLEVGAFGNVKKWISFKKQKHIVRRETDKLLFGVFTQFFFWNTQLFFQLKGNIIINRYPIKKVDIV